MARSDGRKNGQHRAVEMTAGFHRNAEGSLLYRAGGTVVLCTVSVDDAIPKWMEDGQGGWLTAEYQMHPRANPDRRESREGRGRQPKGRTLEIQRLVGRSLRSAMNLKSLGLRTFTVDCDVLEADGGTRTASVTAGYTAIALALNSLGLAGVLRDQVAAISVGYVGNQILVDLDYSEDSTARVDMNVVATTGGRLIEVQSTSEGLPIERRDFNAMLDAALEAIVSLGEEQKRLLATVDADLDILIRR